MSERVEKNLAFRKQCRIMHNMDQIKIAIVALVRVGIAAGIAWLLGFWLGAPYLVMAFILGLLLFWHIFSGRWLSKQLNSDFSKNESRFSFLPLTYEDIRLQDAILKHGLEISRHNELRQDMLDNMRASSDALPDGVIVINANNQVQWANKKATEYVGVRDPEDIGQRIDNLIRHPRFIKHLAESVTGTSVGSIDLRGPFNDNLHLSLSCTLFGRKLRMLAIQDVTDFYRVNKMRQDFIGNASHELRTPLTVIRGYLEEMIDDDSIPREWQFPISEIDKQAGRMQNIIEDMLTLSNLESRSRLADTEEIHLSSLIYQITTDLTQAFQGSHALSYVIPENIYLLGEESELYSVFSNLVKNAILYSPAASNVHLSWEVDETECRVVVKDQGLGIPEESIKRLTERFYRVDDGRSRERGGTGLGLAIVKHALMRHESYLTIESEVGKGSRFICNFPARRHRI